jgi:hypothetical protein
MYPVVVKWYIMLSLASTYRNIRGERYLPPSCLKLPALHEWKRKQRSYLECLDHLTVFRKMLAKYIRNACNASMKQ